MRGILIFISVFIFKAAFSQHTSYNSALLFELEKTKSNDQTYTFLVVAQIQNLQSGVKNFDCKITSRGNDIYSLTCDLKTLAAISEKRLIKRAELIRPNTQVLNDTMLKRNRILSIHQGESPLQQSYDGTGIVLGFVDTGIDFNHPDFKDQNGKSRILYIWDQNPSAGSTVPQPYNYGIEWSKSQIDANVCTHTDTQYWGHGTHVAGIGAGNGLASNSHFGVAPKADIIMVALDFNKSGPTISDAVSYIFSKATALGKPCVINISVGDYYGSHDATDLQSKVIDNEVNAMSGRAVIAAAGNAGSIRYHVKTSPPLGDTSFTWFQENSSIISYFFYADTTQVKNLKFTFGANRPNYSNLGTIGFKNDVYALNTLKTDTLKINGNRIGIIKTAANINADGVYELEAQIIPDTNNLFWRIETTGQGVHDSWNFSFVGNNLPTQAQYPRMNKYVRPDTLYSMVSGFQCSDDVITVANYLNLRYYYDVKDSLHDEIIPAGVISGGSSLGPTRDNRQKPNIAASGQIIFSAGVISQLPGLIFNQPGDVSSDSLHVIGGGTSAASPIVAGLAALYFQKNPTADHHMLAKAIKDCAYQDNYTGTALPNYQWGYGKLDGKNTLLCGDNLVGIQKTQIENKISVYPNPFSETLFLQFKFKAVRLVQIFNIQGQMLYAQEFSGEELSIGAQQLNYKGLLFVKISDNSGVQTFKIVKH